MREEGECVNEEMVRNEKEAERDGELHLHERSNPL